MGAGTEQQKIDDQVAFHSRKGENQTVASLSVN